MPMTYAYESKIDKAFSMLLMARSTLDTVIPECENEQARTIAAEFVAKLIKSAIDALNPRSGDGADAKAATSVKLDDPQSFLQRGEIRDTVDIDIQIGRYLIMASR